MAIEVEGLEEFVSMLEVLGKSGKKITAMALYDGAAVAAEAVVQAVNALPTEPDRGAPRGRPYQVITPEDQAALAEAVGISKFQHSGDSVDCSVGIGGYGGHTEPDYPGGVPMPLIARSIESGSSVRAKHPFFRKAISGARGSIVAKMEETANKIMEEIIGGK
ncbi:MAG: hypothetical protein J6S60_04845 [Oscillospiraceae bacterium]|nr:hypothetical protein [Oscillospiraceae bacterium]